MALFPFYRYHFFNDPFFFYDLDFFDPWFDFDVFPPFFPITPQFRRFEHQERLTYSKTHTTNSPNSLEQAPPVSPPEKFRVQLDVDGFNPDTLNKRIEGRKLIVEGKQEDRQEERKYTNRQMRETFELPEHAGKSQSISNPTVLL
jgi:HSP20 family molecular chaperone IbpA